MNVKLLWKDLELEENLGEGHAGEVWKARLRTHYDDLNPGDFVAVKRYKRWVLQEAGQYERIYGELQAGRSIRHPNAVKTYCLVADEQGLPVLVMEFCSGETLEDYLERFRKQCSPAPVDEAFAFIGAICGGLLAVHRAGFTHRDIKPANIMVTPSGSSKIMDFGVVSAPMMAENTTAGEFLGTIRYASPQYLLGHKASCTDDVYAVGAIAYELLTGKLFYGDEKQWARLVVRKQTDIANVEYGPPQHRYYPYQLKTPPFSSADCKEISQRGDMNTGEAARFVLQRTLSVWRDAVVDEPISNADELASHLLTSIDRAVSLKFWRSAFYVEDERKVVLGEPLARGPGSEKNVPLVSLTQIATSVKRCLTDAEFDNLLDLLKECYWDGEIWKFGRESKQSRLVQCGLVEYHENRFDKWFDFHESVRAAYRYGYLSK